MSKYNFKKKWILETSDNRICPLICYQLSDYVSYDGTHPVIFNILGSTPGFLFDKKIFAEDARKNIVELMEAHQGTLKKKITLEDENYAGDTYPGGKKYKNLKSFLSVKHTIPANIFFKDAEINFSFSLKNGYTKSITCSAEEDLVKANEYYKETRNAGQLTSIYMWPCGDLFLSKNKKENL